MACSLSSRAAPKAPTAAALSREFSRIENDFGLKVQNVTDDMRERMDIPEDADVVVAAAEPGSSAAEAGLRPGTLILEANRQPVRNVGEFRAVLKSIEAGHGLLLLVSDRGINRYVLLKPGNK
jgi:S1-C subfamily serine protease